ncbi:MAG TPA: sulfite exporter TauE/SafE family protein [Microbacteriaceae bacterium]|nr:sulfite exporter TauE/SafE family protein [Microbacteriaceae bacterium]
MRRRKSRRIAAFVAIGLLTGLIAGLFGVGGGAIIVPLLVITAGFDQRLAAGTSLAAIVPLSIAGVASYAARGDLAPLAALILAVGAVVGAQLGTWLLSRIPTTVLRWAFIVFLATVIVGLFVVIPSRDAHFVVTWPAGIALAGTGLVTGVLSGLLGIGGGSIMVPVLMLGFGTSDLVAKGTSLLVIVPTSISGTLGNMRRSNVDLPAAAAVGLAACVTTPIGAAIAALLNPFAGDVLFALFLIISATRMALKAARGGRAKARA